MFILSLSKDVKKPEKADSEYFGINAIIFNKFGIGVVTVSTAAKFSPIFITKKYIYESI